MKSLTDMTPEELLRDAYFPERRRRESPPSLAGISRDQPKEKPPQDGRYEDTLLLLRGVDRPMLEAMYYASSMYQLARWRCHVGGCEQVLLLHEHRDVLGDDGHPLLSQGEPITTVVAVAVHPSAVAEKYQIPIADVRRRISGVLDVIAENMGRRRGATNAVLDESNPSDNDLLLLARRVLG